MPPISPQKISAEKNNILKKILILFLYNQKKWLFVFMSFFYGILAGCSFLGQNPTFLKHSLHILGINLYMNLVYKKNESLKKTILSSFLFFYGYYFISLCWIQLSFVSLGLWWIVPISALAFPVVLSIFYFWFGFSVFYSKGRGKTFFGLVFAFSFWIVELLMSHCLTGFPWILSSYTLNEYAMQGGAYVGAYGMSLIVLLWGTSFFYIKRKYISFLIILTVHALGYYSLKTTPIVKTNTHVRLVHAGITQSQKLNKQDARHNFEKYLALSSLPSTTPIDLVIWPEASLPIALNHYPNIMDEIKEITPSCGYSIIGSPKFDERNQLFTSAYIFDKNNLISIYDKNHLVPFGEYMPFSKILKSIGLKGIATTKNDYTEGASRPINHLKNIPPFCTLICYEIIFPNHVLSSNDERPKWLLNITNDAWYLQSFGIHQHLTIVRWRAIEEGIPIIRCANMGVTCIIDAKGRIISSIKPNDIGVLDDVIPQDLPQTFYTKARASFNKLFKN
ncbi:MAG: Apolipoprotein N-acyltransferase [Holosporales bacterium]